jgi:hypothetical protein
MTDRVSPPGGPLTQQSTERRIVPESLMGETSEKGDYVDYPPEPSSRNHAGFRISSVRILKAIGCI